ncbi:MAG: lysophospholipid acyltransferase family protein, partial [Verrucomicrobiales bacterium]|nr:lysophospholipid acyltransferase family protein [Verrucomicrobiales bacterium]
VFVINHPTHSDPQVVTEVHRQLGIPSCFMAAYDVFLRSPSAAWCMQRLGNFSIDREGSDRKAMATAIETITKGDYALNIFPEGNVYLTNDRVTPFLDGTAFIALKAQKALTDMHVKIIPISLKYSHLTTPRDTVTERLRTLGRDSGHKYDSRDPIPAVMGLGAHLVSDFLQSHGYADQISIDSDSIFETLETFASQLVADVEKALELSPKEGLSLVDRIRTARSKIHQIRIDESREQDDDAIDALADKAILAFRIFHYVQPYLNEHPTIDRYDETVERIAEDYYSKAMPRTGPRRVVAKLGSPIDVAGVLASADGNLRASVTSLTTAMETAVQTGIDEINRTNDTVGRSLLEEATE